MKMPAMTMAAVVPSYCRSPTHLLPSITDAWVNNFSGQLLSPKESGQTYVDKGSGDNNSSTELFENREDTVGSHGGERRHENRHKDTNSAGGQNDEQHSYANANLGGSVFTTAVWLTALFGAINAVPVAS